MLFPGIRHAKRSGRQLSSQGTGIVSLDGLDSAFDAAYIVEISAEPITILCAQPVLEAGDIRSDRIQDAARARIAEGKSPVRCPQTNSQTPRAD